MWFSWKDHHGGLASSHWIMEKAREFQKNIYFCFLDYAKASRKQSSLSGKESAQGLGTSAHSAPCPTCLSSSHSSSPFSISFFPPRTLPDPLPQSWLPPLFPTHSQVTVAHLDSGGRQGPKLVESFSAALQERLQGSLALIMTVDPSDHTQGLWSQALWFRSHIQPNCSVTQIITMV